MRERHATRGQEAAAYRRVDRDERSGKHERDSDAESGDRASLKTRSAVTGLEGQPALKQPSQSSVTPVSGHLSFVTTLSGLPRKEISEEVAAATSEGFSSVATGIFVFDSFPKEISQELRYSING